MAFFKRLFGALSSKPGKDAGMSAVDRYRELEARYPSSGLDLELEAASPQRLPEGVVVRLTITNLSQETRQFCDYHTPFEGIANDIFEVTGAAGKLDYTGPLMSRIPPQEKNFKVLAPGESASAEVDLCRGYAIEPGTYRVRFPKNSPSLVEESSNTVEIEVLEGL